MTQNDKSNPPIPSPTKSLTPQVDIEDPLDLRKILIQVAIGAALIALFLAFIGYFFREPLLAMSKKFVDLFGGFGVALGFMLPDAFTVPLPNDAFTFIGLKGGLAFWKVVAWGSAGSIAGGSIGYLIGRWLGTRRWVIRFFEGRGAEAYALTRKYGLIGLAIAAFTPFPYSIVCWASGAVRLPFLQFLIVSLLRIPRIALFLWLMKLGFFHMGG